MKMGYWLVIFLAVIMFSGCASTGFQVKSTDLAEVEQNWEAHAANMPSPKEIKTLTLVGIHMDFRWIATGLGYTSKEEGQLLRRDAWKTIRISEDGTIQEASAIMGDGCVNILAMFPNVSSEQLIGEHVFVVSGGNDNHSKSLLTTEGKIIGPLARNPKDREEIDLVKLRSDPSYRSQFLARYPSRVSGRQVINASPGTEMGDQFLAEIMRRFPSLAKIDGKSYAVSRQAEIASAETNQASTMDKILSNTHLTLGPGLAAWPVGPALTLGSFILASFYAADMPLNGSFEGARHSTLEVVETVGECHTHLVKQLTRSLQSR
jgi:hypothetical protein